jgi:GNAT superfamily N-acetyltransferase
MWIPFLTPKARDYALQPLQIGDSPSLAAIHQEDFARPWSDDEFAGLLGQQAVFGYVVREAGRGASAPAGFVLARLAAGEGEILTVAVARAHRRQGLGWRLMDSVFARVARPARRGAVPGGGRDEPGGDLALPPPRFPRGRQASRLLPVDGRQAQRRACHAARPSLALPAWEKTQQVRRSARSGW